MPPPAGATAPPGPRAPLQGLQFPHRAQKSPPTGHRDLPHNLQPTPRRAQSTHVGTKAPFRGYSPYAGPRAPPSGPRAHHRGYRPPYRPPQGPTSLLPRAPCKAQSPMQGPEPPHMAQALPHSPQFTHSSTSHWGTQDLLAQPPYMAQGSALGPGLLAASAASATSHRCGLAQRSIVYLWVALGCLDPGPCTTHRDCLSHRASLCAWKWPGSVLHKAVHAESIPAQQAVPSSGLGPW